MATVSSDYFDRPPGRLLTAADLPALLDELPSGPVKYELDNGNLLMMSLPGEPHGEIHATIVTELKVQGERRGHGKAYGEIGIILWKDPYRVVGSDSAFVMKRSLPVTLSPEGFLETPPELVVEVRSKNDPTPYLERKTADYLAAGVLVVWMIDPYSRTVAEYRQSSLRAAQVQQPHKIAGESDLLTCEDVIPGFQLICGTLFSE